MLIFHSLLLQFITEVYLLTMSGLDKSIIGSILEDMVKRITPLLLEIMRIYKDNSEIISVS